MPEYYSFLYPIPKGLEVPQIGAANIPVGGDGLILEHPSSSSNAVSVQADEAVSLGEDVSVLDALPYRIKETGGFFHKQKIKHIGLFNSAEDVEGYLRQHREGLLGKKTQGQAMVVKVIIDDAYRNNIQPLPGQSFSIISMEFVNAQNIGKTIEVDLQKIKIDDRSAQKLIADLILALNDKVGMRLVQEAKEGYQDADRSQREDVPILNNDNPGKNEEERKLHSCIKVLESGIDLKAKMLFLSEFLRVGNGVFSSSAHDFLVEKAIESIEPTYQGAKWNRALELVWNYVGHGLKQLHGDNFIEIRTYIYKDVAAKIGDQLTSKAAFSDDLIAELNAVMTKADFEIPTPTRGCCFTR